MTEAEKKFCFGSIRPTSVQRRAGFLGLALKPTHDGEIFHDICQPLPAPPESVRAIQAEDVLEHIPIELVPQIFDNVYDVLVAGGQFRLSVPDYRSPVLKERSAYDADGNVLADLRMGGNIRFDGRSGIDVAFKPGGDAHLWFPTYELMMELVLQSKLRRCSEIRWVHFWRNPKDWVVSEFEGGDMPVMRCPPRDPRANGKPISIIIDFIK